MNIHHSIAACVQLHVVACNLKAKQMLCAAVRYAILCRAGMDIDIDGHFRGDLDGLTPAAAWGLLRDTLERYDGAQHSYRLRAAAVRAALTKHRGIKLPMWLTAMFQVMSLLH